MIRAELCDKREKYYDRRSIGCYMFRIDDHLVVDATMKGNAARFINHSCDVCTSNCCAYFELVFVLFYKAAFLFPYYILSNQSNQNMIITIFQRLLQNIYEDIFTFSFQSFTKTLLNLCEK